MENKGELHKGHRQRLKSRAVASGINNLPVHEVLELLLTYTIPYKDVNPLAHALINHFGSFSNVLEAGYEQLVHFNGIGHETAQFLDFMPQFFRVFQDSKQSGKIVLNNTSACISYFKNLITSSNFEEAYILSLDGNKKLLRKDYFTSNSSSSISIEHSNFANVVFGGRTKYVIIMHTHPSGSALPSKSDIASTSKVLDMCKMFGIKLIDHMIIGDDEYYSFTENNLFDRNNQEMLIDVGDCRPIGVPKQIPESSKMD